MTSPVTGDETAHAPVDRHASASCSADERGDEADDHLPAAIANPPLPTADRPFLVISGARRLASFNSWTHNIPELVEKLGGNWAVMHPDDASSLELRAGERVRLRSASGEVEVEVREWNPTGHSGRTRARYSSV